MNKVGGKSDTNIEELKDDDLDDMDEWTHKADKKNKKKKNEKNKAEKVQLEKIKAAEAKFAESRRKELEKKGKIKKSNKNQQGADEDGERPGTAKGKQVKGGKNNTEETKEEPIVQEEYEESKGEPQEETKESKKQPA